MGAGHPDGDGDGVSVCSDCDDANSSIYPEGPQICDGLNNDCSDPTWPGVPSDEVDDDLDGFAECKGDCDDTDSSRNPAAKEICNAVDDN